MLFGFGGDTLTIIEESRDCECGFGHGVYIDDAFIRTSSEIPRYYMSIAGEKVYFSQWREEEEQVAKNPYAKIDSRFIACFSDLILGRYDDSRRAIPQDILQELLPDLFDSDSNTQATNTLYAVGKISDYNKQMDLFVCDYEEERPDEDSYDNHVDGARWLLIYGKDGYPLVAVGDDGGEPQRVMHTMCSHYYGEGGASEYRSYFDRDTSIIVTWSSSESESATGFGIPFVSAGKERWMITPSGEKGIPEVSEREFSSPFYDRNYLQQQDWGQVEDEGFNQVYPTVDHNWPLFNRDSISLSFHIERIDGVLIPIFESVLYERRITDRYLVGQPRSGADRVVQTGWCTIKTSDGELVLTPDGRLLPKSR